MNSNIHLNFLISNLSNSGGTQRMLNLLCNELIHQCSIVVFVHQSEKSFFSLDERVKIEVLKGNLMQKNIQIFKSLKRSKSNYYINLDSNSVVFNGVFLPSFTKLIIWEHYSLLNNFEKLFFKISRIYACLFAYKFVLLSNAEVKLWQKKYRLSTNKTNVIYNPITVNEQNVDQTNKYSKKTFIAVGNDIEVKGFDLLLKAWKTASIKDWKLVVVGLENEQINQLNEDVKSYELDNVVVLPRQKNIENLYKNSSVLVLSSRKEATPLTLIESQAFGIPAIVSNHLPGVLEIVNNSALIAEYGNNFVDNLAQLMVSITNEDTYTNLHQNSLINSERFSGEHFVKQWIKLLRE